MILKPLRSKALPRGQTSSTASVPAPVGGWNARDPLSMMRPEDAVILENWVPRTADVTTRKGAEYHATALTGKVRTLASYHSGSIDTLFACTDSGVFDVTSAGAAGSALHPLSSGRCSYINFSTAAGAFLYLVNGVDKPALYNGTSWTALDETSIPALAGIPSTELCYIHAFNKRIWFLRENSLSAYYLEAGAVGGALTEFPLGQEFSKGGKLVALYTWTIDGGNGPEDYLVFITSEGEIALYRGINPNDATSFSKVGTFYVAAPLGDRCFLRYGSDVLVLTENGAFALSTVLSAIAADRSKSISDRISQAFAYATSSYRENLGWEAIVHPTENLLLVNIPVTSEAQSVQYVMNTITKRWCKFSGWDAICWEFFNGELYFGGDGYVAKALVGLSDFGRNITYRAAQAYNYFSQRGRQKHFKLVRPILTTSAQVAISLGASTDYTQEENLSEISLRQSIYGVWDADSWDSALWGIGAQTQANWQSVAAPAGFAISFRLQVSSNTSTVDWSATDYVYEVGGVL